MFQLVLHAIILTQNRTHPLTHSPPSHTHTHPLTHSPPHTLTRPLTQGALFERRRSNGVQLVVMTSCDSEGLASTLEVPHAVAVREGGVVTDDQASLFSKHFYLALFTGSTISKGWVRVEGDG